MTNDKAEQFYNLQDILSKDDYLIPMYQRSYAWGEQEINQLIDDIADYAHNKPKAIYYIGSLVVFDRNQASGGNPHCFEVIDGQQRLTTLNLMAIYLKKHYKEQEGMDSGFNFNWYESPNLHFECRERSDTTLKELFANGKVISHSNDINENINSGYCIIKSAFEEGFKDKQCTVHEFVKFFANNINILRIQVPPHTDLNHYFEVMNNRGEQLEKHEVLKARLLEKLNCEASKRAVHQVWEAVANMNKYVQTAFPVEIRKKLFGEVYSRFLVTEFDDIKIHFSADSSQQNPDDDSSLLSNIIKLQSPPLDNDGKANKDANNADGDNERFNSVINFPNFLMHALRIYVHKNYVARDGYSSEKFDVPLDDKELLKEYDKHLLGNANHETVEDFIVHLLRCKFLFDTYVIKREYAQEREGWSLKTYYLTDSSTNYRNSIGQDKDNSDDLNQRITMILASFHVSIPSMSYKHWLSGTLHWLDKEYPSKTEYQSGIDGDYYLRYLENLANSFVLDRYLSLGEGANYDTIIFTNQGVPQSSGNISTDKLGYGAIENNFVFNYLDYLIWESDRTKYKDFSFSFRSSVEHFFPQNPANLKPLNEDTLHSFGNLCLIHHHQNSSFSNKSPQEKISQFGANTVGNKDLPNLKMVKLIETIKDSGKDTDTLGTEDFKQAIKQHEDEMLDLFINNYPNNI